MILEVAPLRIRPGMSAEFEDAFRAGLKPRPEESGERATKTDMIGEQQENQNQRGGGT